MILVCLTEQPKSRRFASFHKRRGESFPRVSRQFSSVFDPKQDVRSYGVKNNERLHSVRPDGFQTVVGVPVAPITFVATDSHAP